MRRIDDFLIDRVFQRLADALHRFASCYAIGAFLLTGFALIHFFWWGFEVTNRGTWSVYVGVLVSLVWIPARVSRAISTDWRWASGRDVLPPDRMVDIWFRLFFLCATPLDWMAAYVDWSEHHAMEMLGDLSWSLCVLGAYFMACTPKRPRKQEQARLAWGLR